MKNNGNNNRNNPLLVSGIVIIAALFVLRVLLSESGDGAAGGSTYTNVIEQEALLTETVESRSEMSDESAEDTVIPPQAPAEEADSFGDTPQESVADTAEAILEDAESAEWADAPRQTYSFRNERLLNQHYEKHGAEMGFATIEDYVAAANAVINHPDVLHKLEAEDNDDVYFLEATNEFVVVSTDGYIRTYFIASGGIDYYNRQ
ncbi:MAG: hypothetical protein K2O34_08300 [Acetatifactor sp.]|nr:hypothetical protein [Acetatifactor sp.]